MGSSGIVQHGVLYGDSKRVVVHVHGKGGNHFENEFIWHLATAYAQQSLSLFCFSNSGSNYLTEGYRGHDLVFVGGAVEIPDQVVCDISAACDAVASLGLNVVALQGHSFGCEKVIVFIRSELGARYPFVLLSPADTIGNLRRFRLLIESQEGQMKSGVELCPRVDDVLADLSTSAYGVATRDGNWYPVPVTRASLEAWEQSGMLATFGSSGSLLADGGVIYLGCNDQLCLDGYRPWYEHLNERFSNVTWVLSESGDHHLGPDVDANCARVAVALSERLNA